MFRPDALKALYDDQSATLACLLELETALNARFHGMEATVRCMILAALSGEPMVMVGPPGTAKSRLIRSFCHLMGLVDEEALVQGSDGVSDETKNEAYFEYLLTQFTEPSELFGQFDLARVFSTEPSLVREEDGMMQQAQVVFLDEVFNASSAILNALLTFMNERKFHDRGKVRKVPMQLLFAASNQTPRDALLGAFFDRFLLRSYLHNTPADPERLSTLLNAAWTETHGPDLEQQGRERFADLMDQLVSFRREIDAKTRAGDLKINQSDPVFRHLADMVEELRRKELSQMSNRRLVKFAGVILAQALLRAAANGGDPRIQPQDLGVVLDFGLDETDPATVSKLRAHLET
jgi:MoxR-like ATPase